MCCLGMRLLVLFGLTGVSFLLNWAYPTLPVLAWYALQATVFAFILMGVDAYAARRERTRIPETLLYYVAGIGGFLGTWLGVIVLKHKRTKKMFVGILTGISFLWIALIWWTTTHKEAIFSFLGINL